MSELDRTSFASPFSSRPSGRARWSRFFPGEPALLRLLQACVWAGIVLTIVSVWISLHRIDVLTDHVRLLEHARRAQIASAEVLSTAKDLETGHRGFLLTGDRAYLEPFETGSDRIGAAMDRLDALVNASAIQRPRVEQARGLVSRQLDELRSSIALRKSSGLDAAVEHMKTGTGKRAMDELRQVLGEMDAEEARVVAGHAAEIQPAVWWLRAFLLARAVLLVGLLALAWILNGALARRQRELSGSRTLLATTLSSIGDGVIVTDAAGRIMFMNAEAERLTQWKSEQAEGQPLADVFQIVNETTRLPVESPVEKVIRLGTVVGLANHTILIGRDGSEVPIDDSAAPIREVSDDHAPATLRGVVLVFRDFSEHKELERKILDHQRTLEDKVEQRSREIEAAHGRLRAAERMAAMGTLAAGLGHDLSNLILPMQMRLDSLQDQTHDANVQESVAAIGSGLLYLRRLATGLRQMAADPHMPPPPDGIDLSQWWADARSMVCSALPRTIELTTNFPAPDAPAPAVARARVMISNVALTQAVFNLVQNAGEAIGSRPGGRVVIDVQASEDDPARTIVTVSDNGPGMPPEVAARCFEPYFSTKGRAISTGMGLALVQGIMDAARGSVDVRSAPGQGACFSLRIPNVPPESDVSRRHAILAIVDIRDPRRNAIVTAILRALHVGTCSPADGREAPRADLWIARAAAGDAVHAFLGGSPARRAVVLDAPPPASASTSPRVTHLGPDPDTLSLRTAITAAVEGVLAAQAGPVPEPNARVPSAAAPPAGGATPS